MSHSANLLLKHYLYSERRADVTVPRCERKIKALEDFLKNKENILQGNVEVPLFGLCSVFQLPVAWRESVFADWSLYSGNITFPLFDPLNTQFTTPADQYSNCPLYAGNYGELRFKLAKFVLKRLKEDVECLKNV